MGLMIHSLNEIPQNVTRDYYLYLLDYGWKGPLSNIIWENFNKISNEASKTNSVFITGTVGSHVDNEIMSWHHINGEKGKDILPAILITRDNPHTFKDKYINQIDSIESKIILIPIKKHCNSEQDVISLISNIFSDIKDKKILQNFNINKEMRKGFGAKLLNGVILEPSFCGIGFNLRSFFKK